MTLLDRTIIYVTKAHSGQEDKGNHPYIFHLVGVARNVMSPKVRKLPIFKDVSIDVFKKAQIVALLHDIVEDKRRTLEDLRNEGYDEEIIEAVDCLSRREGETYMDFIRRLKKNILAMIVKIADILDNMDVSRIDEPKPEDFSRLTRYEKALKELGVEEVRL